MIVFTVVFGQFAKLPSDGVPYPLLVFSALFPWQFFSNALSESSNSLISNAQMISEGLLPSAGNTDECRHRKLYRLSHRLGHPGATHGVVSIRADLAHPGSASTCLLTFAAAMGAGLWLACLNVRYRDFRYIVPFICSSVCISRPWDLARVLYRRICAYSTPFNPMVGIIDGFRWAILGRSQVYTGPASSYRL